MTEINFRFERLKCDFWQADCPQYTLSQNMILGMSTVHIEGLWTKSTNIYELFKETRCLVCVINY